MLVGNHADTKWSEKNREGEEGLRTVECLRGRLLAERAASRIANEDAELMGNKLMELENQMRLEMKSKNRAEKKLKFLMKKLEPLNIAYVLDDLTGQSSSSSGSSSTFANSKDPEEEKHKSQSTNSVKCEIEEVKKKTISPTISQNLKQATPETTVSNQSQNRSPSSEEVSAPSNSSGNCKDTSTEEPGELKWTRNSENSETFDHSSNCLLGEMEINGGKDNVQDYYVDNSLALVLVHASLQTPPQESELKMVNGSVNDVLHALRRAREQLESSMGRRHMIKVGSIATKIC